MIGITPDMLQKYASQVDLDNDDVQAALLKILEDKADPKLKEIRTRASESPDRHTARQEIESLPEDAKDELFHETWAELIAASVQLRVEPLEGMKNLKGMIRDPYTVETLLLLFEDDEIPDEIVEANKDLVSDYINWFGCAVAPEMYEREEVEEFVETFGADPDLMDKWEPTEAEVDE